MAREAHYQRLPARWCLCCFDNISFATVRASVNRRAYLAGDCLQHLLAALLRAGSADCRLNVLFLFGRGDHSGQPERFYP